MTGVRGVGVLLVVLGLIYAFVYVGWLRRERSGPSAGGAGGAAFAGSAGTATLSGTESPNSRDVTRDDTPDDALDDTPDPTSDVAHEPSAPAAPDASSHDEPAREMTMATAEGTYLSTTRAISRHERVPSPGLGTQAPATMVVDESTVRWEGVGSGEMRVAGTRLLGVRLQRTVVGRFVGRASIIVVSWHSDSGERCATAFLPRHRVETHDLVRAVERLLTADVRSNGTPDTTSQTDSGTDAQDADETTPDGPL